MRGYSRLSMSRGLLLGPATMARPWLVGGSDPILPALADTGMARAMDAPCSAATVMVMKPPIDTPIRLGGRGRRSAWCGTCGEAGGWPRGWELVGAADWEPTCPQLAAEHCMYAQGSPGTWHHLNELHGVLCHALDGQRPAGVQILSDRSVFVCGGGEGWSGGEGGTPTVTAAARPGVRPTQPPTAHATTQRGRAGGLLRRPTHLRRADAPGVEDDDLLVLGQGLQQPQVPRVLGLAKAVDEEEGGAAGGGTPKAVVPHDGGGDGDVAQRPDQVIPGSR